MAAAHPAGLAVLNCRRENGDLIVESKTGRIGGILLVILVATFARPAEAVPSYAVQDRAALRCLPCGGLSGRNVINTGGTSNSSGTPGWIQVPTSLPLPSPCSNPSPIRRSGNQAAPGFGPNDNILPAQELTPSTTPAGSPGIGLLLPVQNHSGRPEPAVGQFRVPLCP